MDPTPALVQIKYSTAKLVYPNKEQGPSEFSLQ